MPVGEKIRKKNLVRMLGATPVEILIHYLYRDHLFRIEVNGVCLGERRKMNSLESQ